MTATAILSYVDHAFAEGDDVLRNAIAVSFVEDVGWWEAEVQSFLAAWPDRLKAEVERQRSGS